MYSHRKPLSLINCFESTFYSKRSVYYYRFGAFVKSTEIVTFCVCDVINAMTRNVHKIFIPIHFPSCLPNPHVERRTFFIKISFKHCNLMNVSSSSVLSRLYLSVFLFGSSKSWVKLLQLYEFLQECVEKAGVLTTKKPQTFEDLMPSTKSWGFLWRLKELAGKLKILKMLRQKFEIVRKNIQNCWHFEPFLTSPAILLPTSGTPAVQNKKNFFSSPIHIVS